MSWEPGPLDPEMILPPAADPAFQLTADQWAYVRDQLHDDQRWWVLADRWIMAQSPFCIPCEYGPFDHHDARHVFLNVVRAENTTNCKLEYR